MIKYPIPAYDKKSGEWRLNLDDKSDYESGPVEIIAGDFIRNNLYYPLEKQSRTERRIIAIPLMRS